MGLRLPDHRHDQLHHHPKSRSPPPHDPNPPLPPTPSLPPRWDYGYQTTAMANRTIIVDNNTWNTSHIATVGRAMASPEAKAWKIYRWGLGRSVGGGWEDMQLGAGTSSITIITITTASYPGIAPLIPRIPPPPRSLDVEYVFVVFGGLIGYSSDDINKFLWMVSQTCMTSRHDVIPSA